MPSVTQSPAWKALQAHYDAQGKTLNLRTLLADKSRFERYHATFTAPAEQHPSILLDYSKNIVSDETLALLLTLARDSHVEAHRDAMFNGSTVNITERRSVLHTALRNRSNTPVKVDGEDQMPLVNAVLAQMRATSDAIRSGKWTGYTGKAITDVVNIGIGGSDLGPVMVTEALKHYAKPGLNVHFVSNVDGTHMAETLKTLDRETTIFIVASKTFTTIETLTNAGTAKAWFLEQANDVSVLLRFIGGGGLKRGIKGCVSKFLYRI
ncbi:glucose-6-phosphate isomerase [Blyttiomyces helicus]|uniref:Glucose-6-phosphate isomerase n=1 Tax=Blyttiomyces helicus TaxID=388810 RepID=A0A4P9W558_9FUNG|nr:glucose-6-phosphate isomerase [Blyttiomyces helicus]|eukprot:RKO85246.1 glucose-6-phosphate isomerase [Blyttiomyces helicus]